MGFAENVANMGQMLADRATKRADFIKSMNSDDSEFNQMVASLPKPVDPTTQPNDLGTGQPGTAGMAPGLGGPTTNMPDPASNAAGGASNMPVGKSSSKAVNIAEQYLGTPYKWGGNDLKTGVDCSGLVQQVYSRLGINLPRVAAEQAKAGIIVPPSQAQPGDLVAFNENGTGVGHIGIYAGNGMMIDAPHTGDHVKIQSINGFGAATFTRIPGHPAPVPGRRMK